MKVYQLIRNEYNSDDGHYDQNPVDGTVYRHETAVVPVRDRLNLESIRLNNEYVNAEIARRWKQREKNGNVDAPPRNQHGIQYHDWCSKSGIEEYEAKSLFTGDPTDLDAIERFTGRFTCLTYYTYDTLVVI